jgi:hypothetical protein
MSSKNVQRLLATAAVTAALVPITASGAGAADTSGPTVTSDGSNSVIAVHAHRTSGAFTPKDGSATQTFPTTLNAGDSFTFVDDLSQNGSKVGTDTGKCTMTDAKSANCDATLTFGNGSLYSIGDAPQNTGAYNVPIKSGTGSYSGATGTAHIVPVNSTSSTDSDVTLTFASSAPASAAPSALSGSSTTGMSDSPTSDSSTAAPADPSSGTGSSQVTTVPQGGAATGTGSTARANDPWLMAMGAAGIVAAGGLLLAGRRSRRATR